ncbi:hypothetical protein E2C01_012531 [Portunus trituberculatus]|uniref:Uncharacterized protein n=1 Tax=Portunus trituberculatus TaxID=210409 RepID=A0A5B7DDW9_PORTR|nr:hypothetical protein [Portunus trituberculatus]
MTIWKGGQACDLIEQSRTTSDQGYKEMKHQWSERTAQAECNIRAVMCNLSVSLTDSLNTDHSAQESETMHKQSRHQNFGI